MKKDNMKSICIVCVYFGEFPNYFQLWLNSCKYNESIDFLIFTDNKHSYNYPKNVRVIYTTFEEIKKKFQKYFDFPINLEKPYKLCDYKPTYGYVFQEYLDKYDFWGHCDFDVIFGDLTNFFNNKILDEYDKIFVNGHFSIYKNIRRINENFKELLDNDSHEAIYKKVFTNNESFCFDEKPGVYKLYDGKKYKVYENYGAFADISVKFNNFIRSIYKKNGNYIFKWYVEKNKGKLLAIYMKDNKIKIEEIMYIHLQKRKMNIQISDDSNFYIIPNKFININEDITKNNFKKYNYKITTYRWYYIFLKLERLRQKILRKVKINE